MPTGTPHDVEAAADAQALDAPRFSTLPAAYPEAIRGPIPTEPEWQVGRLMVPVVFTSNDLAPPSGSPARLGGGQPRRIDLPFVARAVTVTQARQLTNDETLVALGFGRYVSLTDWDALTVGHHDNARVIPTPEVRWLSVACIGGESAEQPITVTVFSWDVLGPGAITA